MKHENAVVRASKIRHRVVAGAFTGFNGTWKNEYGSTAAFTVNGTIVSGTYTSLVSGTGQTVSGPIVGQTSGDVVAFTVLWPGSEPSMTAWVGQVVIVNGVETLETMWNLIMNISDDPNEMWKSVLTGADFFTRV